MLRGNRLQLAHNLCSGLSWAAICWTCMTPFPIHASVRERQSPARLVVVLTIPFAVAVVFGSKPLTGNEVAALDAAGLHAYLSALRQHAAWQCLRDNGVTGSELMKALASVEATKELLQRCGINGDLHADTYHQLLVSLVVAPAGMPLPSIVFRCRTMPTIVLLTVIVLLIRCKQYSLTRLQDFGAQAIRVGVEHC